MPRAVQSGMAAPVRKRFDDFVIDIRSGELKRGDAVVPLQCQPALALAWLVAHAGQLVTRDELRAAIWPSGTHVDFDRGLNYCIRQIRLALEDGAKNPRFVETAARQGYRFIAPVTVVADSTSEPNAAGSPSSRAWAVSMRRLAGAAVTGAAATMIAAAALSPEGASRHAAGSSRHHGAAVALLRNVHTLVFGDVSSVPSGHHVAARSAARALHDLIY